MTDIAATSVAADDLKARRNVMVLAAAGSLGGAVPSINFAVGAIAGHAMLGADKSLATLPLTTFVIGTACGTVPAALLMRQVGRRAGFVTGMLVGAAGALIEVLALARGAFLLFCAGSFLAGFAAAFVQQFRFAAADTASPAFLPRAISLVMAAGIVAAVIGPQAVMHMGDFFPAIPFGGAFVAAAALSLGAAVLLLFLDIPPSPARRAGDGGRPIGAIARRPSFLIAVACATAAAALMSFVMTAAPLAMVMHGHHQDDAVLGIQWHMLAMFGPSFLTGSLIARFGAQRIVAAGLLLLIACAVTGLAGTTVGHFWVGLVLLGLGWNLGFIGGTAMLTATYRPEEKEKVQALNDLLVFGTVAFASFSSGKLLLGGGWDIVNLAVLPFAALALAALVWQMRQRRDAL